MTLAEVEACSQCTNRFFWAPNMRLADIFHVQDLHRKAADYDALLARIEAEAVRLIEAAGLLRQLGQEDGAYVAEDHARRLRELVKEEP